MVVYLKTAQLEAQMVQLRAKMQDGALMTPDDIKAYFNKKWIAALVYYFLEAEGDNVEVIKDGRSVVGYRMITAGQERSTPAVQNAIAAAKRTVKPVSTPRPREVAQVAMKPSAVEPKVDMRAVVVPVKEEKKPEHVFVHEWKDADLENVNGVNLVMPHFLRRK